MTIVTTLNFYGRTEAALKHYSDALGAETLFLMRFRDAPDQTHTKDGMEELVFHATFRIEDTVIMASDVGWGGHDSSPAFAGFSLALRLQSLARGKQIFDALAAEGRVVIPLAASVLAAAYGIVVDRFGISWKIIVNSEVDDEIRDTV